VSKRRIDKPYRPVYPSPAALITSVDAAGAPNVLTLAEVFNVSIRNPVILGIAVRKATYSYGLIVASGEFTVNMPTTAILEQVDQVGSISGRHCPDKFAAFGLTPLPADEIRPPLIAECPVNCECRVRSDQEIGDHNLILGDLVALHIDEDALDPEGNVKIDSLDFFSYLWGKYASAGAHLGNHGFTRKPAE
jgi:flavin reductase (DIM6/NTAB) family NADH-FMN oxidoreductase RutF